MKIRSLVISGAKKGLAQRLLPMVLRLSLALLLLGLASCKTEKPVDPKILDEKVKAEKCLTGSDEHKLIYNCGIVNLSVLREGFNDLANDVQIKLAQAKELERQKAKESLGKAGLSSVVAQKIG